MIKISYDGDCLICSDKIDLLDQLRRNGRCDDRRATVSACVGMTIDKEIDHRLSEAFKYRGLITITVNSYNSLL